MKHLLEHLRLFVVAIAMLSASFHAVSALPGGKSISDIKVEQNLFYRQSAVPEDMDNYLYSLYISSGRKIYNLRGFLIAQTPMDVRQLRVNPAGHSMAVLVSNGKKSRVVVYDLNVKKHKIGQIKEFENPKAIAYTSDSRLLAVADGNMLEFFDSRKMSAQGAIPLSISPDMLEASPASGLLVAADGENLEVISQGGNKVVRKIKLDSPILAMAFDPSGDRFGVISRDNKLIVFDGHDFSKISERDIPQNSTSLSFHPEGKYVVVANSDNRITFLNLVEPADTTTMIDREGGVKKVRFIRDGKGEDYIAYTAPFSIKYRKVSGFVPNYARILEEELNARMAAWSKMRPFETETEYSTRVNETTKAKQKQLFANEIATSLAGDLIKRGDVRLGNYNPENAMLALNIGGKQNVFLTVSQEEAAAFGDGKNLEFRNPVYALTPEDKFELIYAEVYNPSTHKTYTFDNQSRQNLDFLTTDDSFISLDLIRQSSREDARLQDIKEDILTKAKESSILSDHTRIAVSADILSDYDDNGKRINNYKVDFTYTVEPEYSSTEDFPAGKYRIEDSHAAESLLEIVRQAFETDFRQYIKPDGKLTMNLTGTADALPIIGAIPYDGSYGEFESEACRIDDDLASISLESAEGIHTNEQLAFARAQAVRDNLMKGIPDLENMSVNCNYNIEVSKEKGGAHRRINVSLIFVDAF